MAEDGGAESSELEVDVSWGSPGALCAGGVVAAGPKLKLVPARGPWGSAHGALGRAAKC